MKKVQFTIHPALADKVKILRSFDKEGFDKICVEALTKLADKQIAMRGIEIKSEHAALCKKCGSPMVERTGKNGVFYGCSAYPKCRSTQKKPSDKE